MEAKAIVECSYEGCIASIDNGPLEQCESCQKHFHSNCFEEMGREPEDLSTSDIPQFEEAYKVYFCSVECMLNLCTYYLNLNA